jgi:hypothetical protein
MNNNHSHEHEITILENIYNQQGLVRQRSLSLFTEYYILW